MEEHKIEQECKRLKMTIPPYIPLDRGIVAVAKYYLKDPPEVANFETILIHTSSKNLGGQLSPYQLKNEQGFLLENIWQFAKVYPDVIKQRTPVNRFRPDVIAWEHPAETHVVDDQLTPAYWDWRKKGMANWYAVRYPTGFNARRNALFHYWPKVGSDADINDRTKPDQFERLDYITARKRIYCGEYTRLGPQTEHFKILQAKVRVGINLLIVEVDGPDPKLDYPPYHRISKENPGLDIDRETIELLMNDRRMSFGHGYTIAALLCDGAEWLQ